MSEQWKLRDGWVSDEIVTVGGRRLLIVVNVENPGEFFSFAHLDYRCLELDSDAAGNGLARRDGKPADPVPEREFKVGAWVRATDHCAQGTGRKAFGQITEIRSTERNALVLFGDGKHAVRQFSDLELFEGLNP